MAGLPNNTFMSPGVSFYATSGGGAASTLQSPVAVIQDGVGNTTLALTAGGAAGASAVSITGSANGPGNLVVGGFGVNYRMGVQDASGFLQIGINSSLPAAISYDSQDTHQLILGDGSSVATAAVITNVPLVVRDFVNDPSSVNGFAITVDNTTTATIGNGVAAFGTLNIGSSQTYDSTLVVSDVGKNGAATYVQVNGTAGAVPLFITGAQGGGGACYIYPDASNVNSALFLGASRNTEDTVAIQQTAEQSFVDIGGNGGQGVRLLGVPAAASVQTGIITSTAGSGGQLSLGGSSGSANNILISDTTATFDQQIVQQIPFNVTYGAFIALASGTYGPSNNDFSIATLTPGLYMAMMRVNPGSEGDATTMANISSGLLYLQSAPPPNQATTIVVGGGTFGNSNASITAVIPPGQPGASSLRLNINVVTLNISVRLWPLTQGVLPGL